MTAPMRWRPMVEGDVAAMIAVADAVHPAYPEDAAVFAERLHLFPKGGAVLADGEQIVEATLALAARESLPRITLMAVAGTIPFWSRLGFCNGGMERPAPEHDGYGACAMPMVREVAAKV